MRWPAALLPLALVACSYVEETRDVGHKGKARINPYLAAERLLGELGYEVVTEPGWPDLDRGELSMVLVPASVLSAEGYVNALERWTQWGGHTVILLERGESYLNDWSRGGFYPGWGAEVPEALDGWMERAGWTLEGDGGAMPGSSSAGSATEVTVGDETFEVWMESSAVIATSEGEVSVASTGYGSGRLTVVADARPFRNRYIGDHQHASLLARLAESSPDYGAVTFIRNASLSFWALLWEQAWAFVVALLLLTAFWLWKNLPRFGPLDSKEPGGTLRAYDRHLEALGDFHWRLDHGEGLLRPLRESLLERAHRLALSSGRADADVFELMADRAGMPRERAARAMTFERARDAGSFTRLVADLQKLHLSIP